MKFSIRTVAVICFTLLPFAVVHSATHERSELRQVMVRNLHAMASLLEQSYAPRYWKKEFAGWDLHQEVEKATNKINSVTSVRGYHAILRRFFDSMQDYHVSIGFTQTEAAKLPFTVREADGRYFIVWIDRELFSEAAFPFSIGDEIITFNGKPVQEEVDHILSELGSNTPETRKALAAKSLTLRGASSAMTVPKGLVLLGIRRKGETRVQVYETAWTYQEEFIDVESIVSAPTLSPQVLSSEEGSFKRKLRELVMLGASYNMEQKLRKVVGEEKSTNPYFLGQRDSFLPKLGDVVWESDEGSAFQAYIFRKNTHRIGYIRIPQYLVSGGDVGYENNFIAFQKIINQFEKDTDMLVIDQHHNPGGSVFYLYALASVLSDKSLRTPLHHMSINTEDVMLAQNGLSLMEGIKNDREFQEAFGDETIHGLPVNMNMLRMLRDYYRFILEQWDMGNTLTDPYYLSGVNQLFPHPGGQYTRPILVLVDELSFSGGDFFPAILQDNKRATIMGTRTAGAGGYVHGLQLPNIFGIAYISFTASLAKRVNEEPLENLGVTPDISYKMTVEDYQEGYQPYRKAILDAIDATLDRGEEQ